MNLEFDPKADTAEQNFDDCKVNMKKFQHNKIANHQAIGNQQKQSVTSTFIANLDNNNDFDQEQVESIKTFLGNMLARGGRGGGRRVGARGGQAGGGLGQNKKVWKCEFCICSHPRWKDCGCECVNHRRENCPNPDPAKAEAYKKSRIRTGTPNATRTFQSKQQQSEAF